MGFYKHQSRLYPPPGVEVARTVSKQDVLSRKLRLSLNPELINKNESGDDSLFKIGWINQKLTPKELADEINKGIAYTCELSGDRNARNFVRSDVLGRHRRYADHGGR